MSNALIFLSDSVIYLDDQNSYQVPIGEALGNFSNELKAHDYIVEFISTGPKSYYFKTFLEEVCLKMKGFNLSYENCHRINRDTMKQLIDNEISVLTKNFQIIRDSKTKDLKSQCNEKKLTFNFNKRVIVSYYNTLPYGYRE